MTESAGDTGCTKKSSRKGETEEPPDLAAKMCCHSSRAMADYVSEHGEL